MTKANADETYKMSQSLNNYNNSMREASVYKQEYLDKNMNEIQGYKDLWNELQLIVDENGKANFPEGVTLENDTWTLGFVAGWALPNMMGALPGYSSVDGHFEMIREYDKNAEQSGCMGVVFDSTNVADQYTACINAYNKYYAAILAGTLETETAIAQFKAELEASGEAEVIAEKQAQIDAKYGN